MQIFFRCSLQALPGWEIRWYAMWWASSYEGTQKGMSLFYVPSLCIYFYFKDWVGQSTKFFVGCSNWDSLWRDHDTASIPKDVDLNILKQLFKGKSLPEFETVLSCARIVPGHVGAKIRRCRKNSKLQYVYFVSLILFSRLSPLCRWDIEQNGSPRVWGC